MTSLQKLEFEIDAIHTMKSCLLCGIGWKFEQFNGVFRERLIFNCGISFGILKVTPQLKIFKYQLCFLIRNFLKQIQIFGKNNQMKKNSAVAPLNIFAELRTKNKFVFYWFQILLLLIDRNFTYGFVINDNSELNIEKI